MIKMTEESLEEKLKEVNDAIPYVTLRTEQFGDYTELAVYSTNYGLKYNTIHYTKNIQVIHDYLQSIIDIKQERLE